MQPCTARDSRRSIVPNRNHTNGVANVPNQYRFCRLVFVIALMCGSISNVAAQSPLLDLMEKTRKEVAEQPYQYVATSTATNRVTGKIDYKWTDESSAVPGKYFTWRRTVDESYGSTLTSECSGSNSRYLFEMSKKPGAADWTLREVKTRAAVKTDPQPPQTSTYSELAFLHVSFVDDPIDVFLRREGIKHQVVDGADRVVTFRGDIVVRNIMKFNYSGTLTLDLKRGYIKSMDYVRTDASGTVANGMKFTVIDKPGTPPILSKAVMTTTIKNPAGAVISELDGVVESRLTYPTNIPEERFTLSAYGFPEPEGVAWERRTPAYVWLLASAGLLAVLATVFTVLKRRASRPRANPLVTS